MKQIRQNYVKPRVTIILLSHIDIITTSKEYGEEWWDETLGGNT